MEKIELLLFKIKYNELDIRSCRKINIDIILNNLAILYHSINQLAYIFPYNFELKIYKSKILK